MHLAPQTILSLVFTALLQTALFIGLIGVLCLLLEEDPKSRLDAERKKIAGLVQDGDVVTTDFGRSYMVGQGRNYSCRMGLIDLRGSYQTVDSSDGGYKTLHKVNVGNEATFHISHLSIPEDAYQRKASVDDINSAVSNLQLQADEAFQIGELFAIGSTIWKVVKEARNALSQGKFRKTSPSVA